MLGRARLKMDFGKTMISKITTVLFVGMIATSALAQEISEESYNAGDTTPTSEAAPEEKRYEIREQQVTGNGLVEVVFPAEILAPYKERRPDHQFVFHFQYENFKPNQMTLAGQGSYDTVFSGSASVMGLNLGYKYNAPLVGLEVSGFFGSGGLGGGKNGSGYSVEKKGVRLAAIFDDFAPEPYLAPYVGLQIVKWDVKESSNSGASSAGLDAVMGTQIGLLVQLNWLEPASALRALNEDGLNNSYLDLFMQQYGATSGTNLASAFNWGAGFRLEY